MLKGIRIVICLVFTLIPAFVVGQACCSGGVPLSGSLNISSLPSGSLDLRFIYDFNYQHALFSGNRKLDDNLRSRTTHSILLRSGIAISKRIAVYSMFSFIQQEELNKNALTGENFFTKAFGPGDMVLAFQYQPISSLKTELVIASGIKIPIGSTGKVQEETGIPLNPDMQPGSGSWDGLFLMSLDQLGLFHTSLGFSLNSSFRLTSQSFRYNHQIPYRFGNEFLFSAGFFNNFVLKGALLYPYITWKYRFTEKDQTNGFNAPNTGGHWVYLVAGSSFFFNPDFGLNLRAELPIYRELKGTQLTTSLRFHSSLIYRLSLKKRNQPENPEPGI